MNDNRISEISYCGYHENTTCRGFTCCISVGIHCDVGLRFPDDLQTYACCDDLLGGCTFRMNLPVSLAGPGALYLVWQGFTLGCVGQLHHQDLCRQASAGTRKVMMDGCVKKLAMGWSEVNLAAFLLAMAVCRHIKVVMLHTPVSRLCISIRVWSWPVITRSARFWQCFNCSRRIAAN